MCVNHSIAVAENRVASKQVQNVDFYVVDICVISDISREIRGLLIRNFSTLVLIHRDKERRGIDEDVIEMLQHLMSRLTNSVMCIHTKKSKV